MTARGGPEATGGGAEGEAARPTYCDHCGQPLDSVDHTRCAELRRLEPPRFCPYCRRRMVVQVVPRGWSARCARHGEL